MILAGSYRRLAEQADRNSITYEAPVASGSSLAAVVGRALYPQLR